MTVYFNLPAKFIMQNWIALQGRQATPHFHHPLYTPHMNLPIFVFAYWLLLKIGKRVSNETVRVPTSNRARLATAAIVASLITCEEFWSRSLRIRIACCKWLIPEGRSFWLFILPGNYRWLTESRSVGRGRSKQEAPRTVSMDWIPNMSQLGIVFLQKQKRLSQWH